MGTEARSPVADLRAAGLKITPQRLAILQQIAQDPTHPTAQELYERLLPEMPGMSFATVYNTLDALAKTGLCSVRSLSPGASRFDPNMAPHDHVVCDACGLVRDVSNPSKNVSGPAVKVDGFVVRAVEQVFRGLCDACASSASSSKKRPRTAAGS